MEISTEDVAKTTSRLLAILEANSVTSVKNIEGLVGKKLPCRGSFEDFLKVEKKVMAEKTTTYILKYFNPKTGVDPVFQININKQLKYSVFIIKAHENLEGYEDYSFDESSNKVQNKTLKFSWFGDDDDPEDKLGMLVIKEIKDELYRVRNIYTPKTN